MKSASSPSQRLGLSCSLASSATADEQGSVLITTNLDFASWTEVFGDARLTGALLDRLTHRCHIIEFQGADSFRLQRKPAAQGQDSVLTRPGPTMGFHPRPGWSLFVHRSGSLFD